MKVALTTSGETLEAPLDPRFGRAPRFLVFDTDTTAFKMVDNRAGMEAAQGRRPGGRGRRWPGSVCAASSPATAGPKALRVLVQAGIQVYNTDVPTVAAALEAYRAGKLVTAEPTVSGEHDLDRLLVLARHFDVPVSVCVNKWDVNPGMTERIERRARRAGAGVVGRVRQDPAVSRAQVRDGRSSRPGRPRPTTCAASGTSFA